MGVSLGDTPAREYILLCPSTAWEIYCLGIATKRYGNVRDSYSTEIDKILCRETSIN